MVLHPNFLMLFDQSQIDELKQVSPDLRCAEDGGRTYFLLKDYPLPNGCTPTSMDLLLCPNPGNGYNSLLYFSTRPTGSLPRNWNGKAHVFGRNWISFSWKSGPGHTLLHMLQLHLNALFYGKT